MKPEDKERIKRDRSYVQKWVNDINNYVDFCRSHDFDLNKAARNVESCFEKVKFATQFQNSYKAGEISAQKVIANVHSYLVGATILKPSWVSPTLQPGMDLEEVKNDPNSSVRYHLNILTGLEVLLSEGVVRSPHKEHLAAADAPSYVTRYFDSPVKVEVPQGLVDMLGDRYEFVS